MMLLLLILIWRGTLFLIALVTQIYYNFTPTFPYSDIYLVPSKLPQWIWAWANFDGVHYLTIAKSSYSANFTQAFFPAYPIVLRFVSSAFFDSFKIITGIVLSIFFIYLALYFFIKLLRLDGFTNPQIKMAILFTLIFPTSFFLAALYTESFFLFLEIACFYCARRNKWLLAGILGMLASATKITGILLLPSLIWEWIIANKLLTRPLFKNYKINFIFNICKSPFLYLVPLGLLLYMTYLYIQFKDPLLFWHVQSAFGASRSSNSLIFIPQVIWRYLKILSQNSFYHYDYWVALVEFCSFIFAFLILVAGMKYNIRKSYLLYSWLLFLTPIFTGTFSSLPRYILIIFPIYMILAKIKNIYICNFTKFIFLVLLIILTSNFIRGLWVA